MDDTADYDKGFNAVIIHILEEGSMVRDQTKNYIFL